MSRHVWSARELAFIRRLYADVSTKKLALALRKSERKCYNAAHRMGLHKSEQYMASPDAHRISGTHPKSIAHRFPKGQVPHNKGLRRPGYAPGRMAETQFKKGQRTGAAARNWKPVGTILQDTEGFLRIKVREHRDGEATGFGNTKIWPLLNRHVWEQHKGPIPPRHIVAFKDRNRSNCDIGNLELISCADNMRRNSIHRLPPELKEVLQLKAAIERRITIATRKESYAKKRNSGPAQPSVRDARVA